MACHGGWHFKSRTLDDINDDTGLEVRAQAYLGYLIKRTLEGP